MNVGVSGVSSWLVSAKRYGALKAIMDYIDNGLVECPDVFKRVVENLNKDFAAIEITNGSVVMTENKETGERVMAVTYFADENELVLARKANLTEDEYNLCIEVYLIANTEIKDSEKFDHTFEIVINMYSTKNNKYFIKDDDYRDVMKKFRVHRLSYSTPVNIEKCTKVRGPKHLQYTAGICKTEISINEFSTDVHYKLDKCIGSWNTLTINNSG